MVVGVSMDMVVRGNDTLLQVHHNLIEVQISQFLQMLSNIEGRDVKTLKVGQSRYIAEWKPHIGTQGLN